jgi:hypothetical protein
VSRLGQGSVEREGSTPTQYQKRSADRERQRQGLARAPSAREEEEARQRGCGLYFGFVSPTNRPSWTLSNACRILGPETRTEPD